MPTSIVLRSQGEGERGKREVGGKVLTLESVRVKLSQMNRD